MLTTNKLFYFPLEMQMVCKQRKLPNGISHMSNIWIKPSKQTPISSTSTTSNSVGRQPVWKHFTRMSKTLTFCPKNAKASFVIWKAIEILICRPSPHSAFPIYKQTANSIYTYTYTHTLMHAGIQQQVHTRMWLLLWLSDLVHCGFGAPS